MSIEMEIADNGNGGSGSHTSGGNGLKNMKHRVEQHGGTFRINQSPESGTCLNFIFPLKGSLHITHSGTHPNQKI
jgi:signal transduction histidine kinase